MAEPKQGTKVVYINDFLKRRFIEKQVEEVKNDPNLDSVCKAYLIDRKAWADIWEYSENLEWLRRNIETVRKRYPDQWVLVFEREIIFSSKNLERARAKLGSLGNRINECYICYIFKEKRKIIADTNLQKLSSDNYL